MALKTLGMTNGGTSIRIFDRFEIDYDLPKWKKIQEEELKASKRSKFAELGDSGFDPSDEESVEPPSEIVFTASAVQAMEMRRGVLGSSNPQRAGNITVSDNGSWISNVDSIGVVMGSPAPVAPKPEPESEGFWKRVLRGVYRHQPPRPIPAPKADEEPLVKPEPPVPVQYVFDLILKNEEQLSLFNDRNKEFEALIERTEKAGQKSLLKKLRQEAEIRKYENALYAKGQTKFISEAQLLKFVEKAEKGLSLDWIQHFARPIPAEVIDKKVACDNAYLFDNWVVLHYDPEGKAITPEDREAEIARRRDPILFGVMLGSRKLYFVADWKDAQCDLTLQEIVDKIGESVDMLEHI